MTDHVENNIEEGTLAADSLHPAAKPVKDDPKSKIGMIAQAIGAMNAMTKSDFTKWFDGQQALFGPGKTYGVGDNSASNQSSIDSTLGSGPKTRMPMPKLGVKEDVEEMFAGSDLSEEFKEKATTLFEAAVSARIITETARLEEEFEDQLVEAVAEINEELTSKVDSYLDYVVENWMKENEVAIESTLRNEAMGEFIDGLKNLFAEHYIEVPEEKVNVLESLADKVEELESRLNEQIDENVELRRAFVDVEKKEVFESYLSDLAMSQQEKFKALAEGIDFDGDIETYAKKLSIIKENYFGVEKTTFVSTNIVEETFDVGETQKVAYSDPSVHNYVEAISRSVKR